MSIKRLGGRELLEMFEERVRCDHYCPYDCRHQTKFGRYEIETEILRRIDGPNYDDMDCEEQLCSECGNPTMHDGNVCFWCSKKDLVNEIVSQHNNKN